MEGRGVRSKSRDVVGLPEQLAVADCRGSACQGQNVRGFGSIAITCSGRILVRPDAPLPPALAPLPTACASSLVVQQSFKRPAPSGRERFDPQRPFQSTRVDGWANREVR